MLMVKVFAVFGKADCGKALFIEGAVVAAAQVAITTEDQLGSKGPKIISFANGMDVARQFARGGIIFSARLP